MDDLQTCAAAIIALFVVVYVVLSVYEEKQGHAYSKGLCETLASQMGALIILISVSITAMSMMWMSNKTMNHAVTIAFMGTMLFALLVVIFPNINKAARGLPLFKDTLITQNLAASAVAALIITLLLTITSKMMRIGKVQPLKTFGAFFIGLFGSNLIYQGVDAACAGQSVKQYVEEEVELLQ